MGKDNDNTSSNIIQFPNVKHRLAEKGMIALKNKQYDEALQCFEQLLASDPSHPQANFGLAICYVELHMLHDAIDICEKMLREAIGDYYEVLQIYVSVLIQLEQYEKVVHTLEAINQEEKLPADLAEFFYQLLAFCRKMIQDEGQQETADENIEQYIDLLNSMEYEKQLIAIKKLCESPNEYKLEILKTFLKDEMKNPLVKSMIIKNLAEQNVDKPLEIIKFSQHMTINPLTFTEDSNEQMGEKIVKQLQNTIEDKNPTLYSISIQILTHYLLSIYPFSLPDYDEEIWAAAVHYISCELNGISLHSDELCELYDVEKELLMGCVDEISAIIKHSYE